MIEEDSEGDGGHEGTTEGGGGGGLNPMECSQTPLGNTQREHLLFDPSSLYPKQKE